MMLSSSGDSVKLWDTDAFKLIQEVPGSSHNDFSALSWNKDGQILASLNKNSSEITLYTVNSSSAICSLVMQLLDNVNCLQFCNTTNRYLAAAGDGDTLLVWDIRGNFKKKSFTVSKAGISKLSFSPSDAHIVAGTLQGDAYFISNSNNLITGPVRLFSEKTRVNDVQFNSLKRSCLGVCGENGNVALMDMNTSKVVKEFQRSHSAPVSSLAFSPINDLLMISVGYDKKFVGYNANTKSVVLSHQCPHPLTSAAFMSNGQQVALGTMNGKVLINDLRNLTSPLAILAAHKGPVYDLEIQPYYRNTFSRSSKPGNRNKSAEKGSYFGTKEQRTNLQPNNFGRSEDKGQQEKKSPSKFELLSPLNSYDVNHEETLTSKTPLLKSFKTPARPSRRETIKEDDLGILSPIDKENQSPRQSLVATPLRQSITKETPFVEGLLSPLSNVSSQSNPNDSDSKSDANNHSVNQELKDDFDENYSELLLSPLHKSKEKHDDDLSCQEEGISQEAPPCNVSKEQSDNTNSNTLRESLKQNPVVRELGFPSDNENTSVCNTVTEPEHTEQETRHFVHIVEDNPLISATGSSHCSDNVCVKNTSSPSATREIYPQNTVTSLSNSEQKHEEFVDVNTLHPADSEDAERSEEKGKSAALFAETNKFSEDVAHEIAFPHYRVGNEYADAVGGGLFEGENNWDHLSSSKINFELIQNCISEAIERHEFSVNKKFMHMHWSMLKHFMGLKKEMRRLFSENSINEELLKENQRLKEEIKKLKCTY